MAVDITLYRPTVYDAAKVVRRFTMPRRTEQAYTEKARASRQTKSRQTGTVALLCSA